MKNHFSIDKYIFKHQCGDTGKIVNNGLIAVHLSLTDIRELVTILTATVESYYDNKGNEVKKELIDWCYELSYRLSIELLNYAKVREQSLKYMEEK